MEELKKLIEAVKSNFESFKKTNDARLQAIEDGKGHAELDAKLEKIETAISAGEVAIKERYDGLEAKFNRAEFDQRSTDKIEIVKDASVFSAICGRPVNVEDYEAYTKAFGAYLRTAEMSAAMQVGNDTKGGFWVTPSLSNQIATLLQETSDIRPYADVQTIGSDAEEGDRDLDEAAVGWVGENETRSETDTPDLGEYRIDVHEMYAMPKASQKFLNDSSRNVETWLAGKVANKMSREENTRFVAGNGIKKPRGIIDETTSLSAPSAASAALYEVIQRVNSGQAGGYLTNDEGDKLIDLLFKLKPAHRRNARWFMNRLTLAATRKLKDGDDSYLWLPDFSSSITSGTLLGHPIVEFEDMPDLAANSLSVGVGDLKGYAIRDRQGISILRDPFTTKGQVKFYTTKRVGGRMKDFDTIKLMKFAA